MGDENFERSSLQPPIIPEEEEDVAGAAASGSKQMTEQGSFENIFNQKFSSSCPAEATVLRRFAIQTQPSFSSE